MRCIGIDPGSKAIVWGIVEPRAGGLAFVAAGEIDVANIEADLVRVIQEHRPTGGAIERPVGFSWQDFNPAPLIETAWYGGLARGILTAMGIPCHSVTMSEWRGSITRRVSPGDPVIKAAILDILGASLPRQTNNHVRDALGVAVFGRSKHIGGTITLSAKGFKEVEELWQAQQAKNTSKGQRTKRASAARAVTNRADLGVVRRRAPGVSL